MDKIYAIQIAKLVVSYAELLYIGMIIICFIVRIFLGDTGWVALFFSLFPSILIPLPFINLLGLINGKVLSRLSFVLTLIILCIIWLPKTFQFHYKHQKCNTHNSLSIYSHNTGQYNVDNILIIDQIKRLNPDLIILQEVNVKLYQSLIDSFDARYKYFHAGPFLSELKIGMLIMSRFEITQYKDYKLDHDGLVFQQDVMIKHMESTVRIINVHTTFPWFVQKQTNHLGIKYWNYDDSVRNREISSLLKSMKASTTKTILAGDFNMSHYSNDYYRITKQYKDSQQGIYQSYTWPSGNANNLFLPIKLPIIKLDYLFHSSDFLVCESATQPPTGSDHLPIFTVLTW
jgi:endonuclease/exonuclease/phosphatase family metal-dependent hydrolase